MTNVGLNYKVVWGRGWGGLIDYKLTTAPMKDFRMSLTFSEVTGNARWHAFLIHSENTAGPRNTHRQHQQTYEQNVAQMST